MSIKPPLSKPAWGTGTLPLFDPYKGRGINIDPHGYGCLSFVDMPSAEDLARSGIKTFSKGKEKAPTPIADAAALRQERRAEKAVIRLPLSSLLALAYQPSQRRSSRRSSRMTTSTSFNELPPAKGKGRSINQSFEGQIIVV